MPDFNAKHAAAQRRYWAAHQERLRKENAARMRKWHKENREASLAISRRTCAKRKGKYYGLSKAGIHRKTGLTPTRPMPTHCEICGRTQKGSKKFLCFDHDHLLETFRGWLCDRCNRALGLFRDSVPVLESAIRYLKASYGRF